MVSLVGRLLQSCRAIVLLLAFCQVTDHYPDLTAYLHHGSGTLVTVDLCG
jgi:hypothetical protein